MVSIIIDYRERNLLELFPNAIKENLDVGDVKIVLNDYIFVIERKTISDLLSSIKYGRYKEQKIRVLSYVKDNYEKRKFFYILEGDIFANNTVFYSEYEKNIVLGTIISNQLRDNIPILISKDVYSTKLIIEKLVSRMKKDASELFSNCKKNINSISNSSNISNFQSNTNIIEKCGNSLIIDSVSNSSNLNNIEEIKNESYTSTIKLKKKENLNSLSWWLLSLSQIPGVGNSIAEMIINTYPTNESLMKEYLKVETEEIEKELLLSEIRTSSTENARKIGKIISSRIYKFIMNKL